MQSLIVKRSVVIGNRCTSVSVEDDFWQGLREIARLRCVTLSQLLSSIDADRQFANLSSAIRLFVLRFFREQLAEQRPMLEAAE
jgi:predicted DNA-binding ribbon-helix-helix protein